MATTITQITQANAVLTKSGDLIRVNGSDYAALKQVKGTGADLDTPATPVSFPIIQDSNFTDSQETSNVSSEGNTVYEFGGNITVNFQLTSLQSDGNAIKYLQSMRGKYFQIVKRMNDTPMDGAYFFAVFPIAKAIPSANLTGLNPTTVFDFGVNKTEIDTTVDFSEYDGLLGSDIDFSASTTPETMVKGDWYYIFKVTI